MRTKHRTLLSLEVYQMTGNEIGQLRKQFSHDRYLTSVLPKFCIDSEGKIHNADYWLQFTDDGEESLILFDVATVDKLLSEELSNMGLEDMVKNVDLRPYLDHFTKHTRDDLFRILPSAEYLIIDITYRGGGFWDEHGDFDVDFDIAGAMVGNNLREIHI